MEKGRRIPWIIKYRPKRLEDYVDQEEAKTILVSWIREWLKKTPSRKAALLYGPPGTGKTSLVEAIANEFNMDIIEMNASDFRRREDIERVAIRAATQYSLTGRRKIILLDEIDGLSGNADKGGVEAILRLITVTIHPVVMTANNPWHNNLRDLRNNTLMVQFRKLKQTDVIKLLKKICEKEGIQCEDKALKIIHEKNKGDLRACINDLQSIAEAYGRVTENLALALVYYRDRELDPFETLRTIFTAKYAWQAKNAVGHSQLDPDMLSEWLSENIPLQLTDPEDMHRAYEALSRALVYKGRIARSGSWDLLAYVIDMLGPGVSRARRKTRFKWVAFRFPQKIKMLSETKKSRENLVRAASKIGSRTHDSTSKVIHEYIPIIRALYKTNPEKTVVLLKEYEITPEEAQVIVGSKDITELYAKTAEKRQTMPKKAKRGRRTSSSKRRGQTTLL